MHDDGVLKRAVGHAKAVVLKGNIIFRFALKSECVDSHSQADEREKRHDVFDRNYLSCVTFRFASVP
jgi:hypothetical protein